MADAPKPVSKKKAAAKKGQAGASSSKPGPSSAKAAAAVRSASKPVTSKGLFAKDLPTMMYGFGDDKQPYAETVDVVEDILIDYMTSVIKQAVTRAGGPGVRPTPEHLLHVVRKDAKKYNRAKNLLAMQIEIREARQGLTGDTASVGVDGASKLSDSP